MNRVRRMVILGSVGTAVGAFSGLFGMGGGVVIIPPLIFLLAYGEREAAGTSLAALAIVTSAAAAVHALYGNVDLAMGLLLGVPGVAGVTLGRCSRSTCPSAAVAGSGSGSSPPPRCCDLMDL